MEDIYKERFSLLSNSKLLILEEGTHHVHLDEPQLLLNDVLQFINGDTKSAKL